MSQVQSATADPAKVAARRRQAAVDSASASATSAETNVNFASLLAVSRGSAWMDGVMSQQAKAAAARKSEAREASATDTSSEVSRPEDREESSEPSDRSERVKETARDDRADASDEAQASKRQATKETSDRQAERATDKHQAEQYELRDRFAADGRSQAKEASSDAPAAAPETVTQPTQGQSAVQASASPTAATQSPVITGQPLSAADSAVSVFQMNTSASPTTETPAAQAVALTGSVVMPVATNAAGGQTNANAQENSTGAATGANAGNAASKTATSNNEFQTMMQQVGRERAAVVRQAVAASAKPTTGGTIQLERPEAIDQLARVLRSTANGKSSSMTLRLDPPELGQLRVDVKMQDQTLVLRFQADTQAARDLLDSRMSDLRQALEQHGIRLDRADVEIRSPAPSDQQNRETDNQPAQQHHLPQGGESDFNQARGQQGDGDGSQESGSSTGAGTETWTGLDASVLAGLSGDGVGASAETGVDLVV